MQAADAASARTPRPPAGLALEGARVGDVVALVAGAPVRRRTPSRAAPFSALDAVEQVLQADRVARPAADVEHAAREAMRVLLGAQEGIDQVVDEQDVAHLHAVAEQRDGSPRSARRMKCATQPWSSVPNWRGP
jgi:hypothetical protein